MKKTFKVFTVAAALSISVAVMPVPAQAQVGNIFKSFSDSIRQKMGRVMLALPGKKSGSAVLQQAALVADDITSTRVDASIDTNVIDKSGQDMLAFNLRLEGPMLIKDIYDPKSAQQDLHVNGELSMQGTSMVADADLKIDGKVIYFKLNQVPAIPFFPANQIKDQWLKMDLAASSEAMMIEDPGNEAEVHESTPLTTDQRQQLKDLSVKTLKNSEIGDATKETLDGHKVFVVEVKVPDQVIIDYIKESSRIQKIAEAEITEAEHDARKSLERVDEIMVKFYIDRSSFYTRQLELPLKMDVASDDSAAVDPTAALNPLGDFSQAQDLELMLKLTMDEFNQPVDFTAPSDARDAAEVFAEVMGGSLGGGAGVPAGVGFGETQVSPPVGAVPNLTAEEVELLKQYGINPADLQ
jgi:hypothetical protein